MSNVAALNRSVCELMGHKVNLLVVFGYRRELLLLLVTPDVGVAKLIAGDLADDDRAASSEWLPDESLQLGDRVGGGRGDGLEPRLVAWPGLGPRSGARLPS